MASVGREIPTHGKNVQLGWVYKSNPIEYSPPIDSRGDKYEEYTTFDWNIYNQYSIKETKFYGSVQKEIECSSAKEMIIVHMKRRVEKTIKNNDNSSDQNVVTSLFYEDSLFLLLFYEVSFPECISLDLPKLLDKLINDVTVTCPISITQGLAGITLYSEHRVISTNNGNSGVIWFMKQACNYLKNANIENPSSVFISTGKSNDSNTSQDVAARVMNQNYKRGNSDNKNRNPESSTSKGKGTKEQNINITPNKQQSGHQPPTNIRVNGKSNASGDNGASEAHEISDKSNKVENHLVSYEPIKQNNISVSPNKISNSRTEINNENLDPTANSSYSSIMPKEDKASHSGRASTENSENSSSNSGNIFKKLQPSKCVIDPCGMKRYYYQNASSDVEEKVILLLGASGSGKTTLINFVANFFEGVETPDCEKIVIAPASMKTKEITAYTFNFVKDTSTVVTIIDTPGLNDSSGSEIRDHVNSLKIFLANTATHNIKIHMVGFVAQAHIVRLTSAERLVMDYVSTLFGEAVNENIITLISFADFQASPPVVDAITTYGMKIKHFLKFNNAVLNDASDDIDDLDRVYWRTGFKSWKKVIKLLNDLQPLSPKSMLNLQKEVYAKTVIESSVKELNDELLNFISIYEAGVIKTIRNSSHQVWNLVTIVHFHLRHTSERSDSVESLLVKSLKGVCGQEKMHKFENLLKALSYYSLRGLEDCTHAIINSMYPVYLSAKIMKDAAANESSSHSRKRKLLYCCDCKDDHIMERKKGIKEAVKQYAYIQSTKISYRCTDCHCKEEKHGVKYSASMQNSFGSDVNRILRHTKDMLASVVGKYSLPHSNLTVNFSLMFLLKHVKAQGSFFIKAILEI